MASVIISGDSSGTITLSAPSVAGSNTATLPAQTGTLQMLGQGTAVASTSGTSITFTGIPSWVKRVTVMFNGVSGSGTSNFLIQLGSGTIQTTGYVGGGGAVSVINANTTGGSSPSNGFYAGGGIAAAAYNGSLILNLVSSNYWVGQGIFCAGTTGVYIHYSASGISLSGTLDRVVITTVNGTDTFDAGSVNILYEG